MDGGPDRILKLRELNDVTKTTQLITANTRIQR